MMPLDPITGLVRYRWLCYFLILCNALSMDTVTDVDVNVIMQVLPLCDISAKVIYTVEYGDPMASYRLCICGCLSDEENTPHLALETTSISSNVELGSSIDVSHNTGCFSIACLPNKTFDFTSVGKY